MFDMCKPGFFSVFIELKEKKSSSKITQGCIFDKTTTFQRFFFSQFCPKWILDWKTSILKKCTWLSREDGGLLPLLLVDEEGGPSSKMAVTSVPASAAEWWWQVWSLTQLHSVDFSQSRFSVRESLLLLDRRSIDLSGAQEKEVYFHYENFLRAS